MNNSKIWRIICYIMLWYIITGFSIGSGYFEYKYYCDIKTNTHITITTKPDIPENHTCLSYLKTLNQNINNYSQEVKIAQINLIDQPEYSGYWNSYIDSIQPKLLQAKILHIQIIKTMNKFEQDLFRKTMIYINYRYKTSKKNLIKSLTRHDQSIITAIQQWDSEAIIAINTRYRIEKLKLEILNIMLQATSFKELMPFYNQFKELWK